MITYGELLTRLQKMNFDELLQHVTIYSACWDEFFPVDVIRVTGSDEREGNPADGVLDNGHVYLELS